MEEPLYHSGKHTFYRDVYVFVDRMKDVAPVRGEEKLRLALPQCFKNLALYWHSFELSDLQKSFLRNAAGLRWSG